MEQTLGFADTAMKMIFIDQKQRIREDRRAPWACRSQEKTEETWTLQKGIGIMKNESFLSYNKLVI
ncbi:hypothetical protein, partial [Paenibacillus sp. AR247]|uniref:hypothetical protein n=1 Tax=Paenibacillus sp. AR247 TaxID=1631599 RepID=UPI000D4B8235